MLPAMLPVGLSRGRARRTAAAVQLLPGLPEGRLFVVRVAPRRPSPTGQGLAATTSRRWRAFASSSVRSAGPLSKHPPRLDPVPRPKGGAARRPARVSRKACQNSRGRTPHKAPAAGVCGKSGRQEEATAPAPTRGRSRGMSRTDDCRRTSRSLAGAGKLRCRPPARTGSKRLASFRRRASPVPEVHDASSGSTL
jgi:hypothetical protein